MNLLSDAEIDACLSNPSMHIQARIIYRDFARAIEAAILAKLASAELPEPLMKTFRLGPMFTTEQMTDYTKLIERLRNTPNWQRESYGDWKQGTVHYDRAPFEAADAIEALQEENALLEGTLESRERNIAALQSAIEALRKEVSTLDVLLEECKMDWSGDVTQIKAEHKHEIDALQSKLDELRRQEPVEYQSFTKQGFISCSPASWEPCTHEQYQDFLSEGTSVRKLYAAPKALAPEKGTELFDAWCDKSYADGMLLGWNLCESNHPETFQQLRSTRTEAALKVILANRAAHGIGGTP